MLFKILQPNRFYGYTFTALPLYIYYKKNKNEIKSLKIFKKLT